MTGDTVSLDLATIKWMIAAVGAAITTLVGATIAVWRDRKQLEDLSDAVFGADKKTGDGGLERLVLGNAARNEKGLKVRVEEIEKREEARDQQTSKHGDVLRGVIKGFDVFGSGEHEVAMKIRERLAAPPAAVLERRRELVQDQEARFEDVHRSRTPTGPQRRLDPRVDPDQTPPAPPPPKRRI